MELGTNWALVEEEARSKNGIVPPSTLCSVYYTQYVCTDTDKKLLIR